MPRYVDVGVKQVQTWLVRAPSLKGRRGASTMLTRATDEDVVRAQLADLPAVQHHDAGHVDGVISVRIEPDGSGVDLDQMCDTVERHLVSHLRIAAPAAFLQATWREGENYADAYDRITRITEHPPAVNEWAGARQCEWCHLWPASDQIWDGAGDDFAERQVCADCKQRSDDDAAGRTTANRFRPLAEKRLLAILARHADTPAEFPNTFEELSELGPVAADRTHLATIFADGNAIGALIAALRTSAARTSRRPRTGGEPPVSLADAPRVIDDATWNAAAKAVTDISTPVSGRWWVIPHLVGGDDLLVSVPAHTAWQFVLSYLTSFVAGTHALARSGMTPSASAGVVIHHCTEPISLVVDLADDLLRKAKSEHTGKTAALAWQSITNDGSSPLHNRHSITAEDLRNFWDDLSRLAAVATSQRQIIARVDREGGDVMAQLQRVRSGDNTMADLVAPFLGKDAAIPLATALAMSRWWWIR